MALKLIEPPTFELVTLAQAKDYMRVDTDDSDDLIEMLIVSAREHIEGPPRNAIYARQTWQLVLDKFPTNEIMLPLNPVQGVTQVRYFDAGGIDSLVSGADYYVDVVGRPPYVIPVDDFEWPDTQEGANMVTVDFVAGFLAGESGEEANANIPKPVRLAVLQLVSHWFERRDMLSEAANLNVVPEFVWTLLHRYRMFL